MMATGKCGISWALLSERCPTTPGNRGSRSIWTAMRWILSPWMRRSVGSTGAKHASSSSCCSGAPRRQRGRQPSACWQQRLCRRERSRRLPRCSIRSQRRRTRPGSARRFFMARRSCCSGNRRPDRWRGARPRAVTNRARRVPAHEADPAGPRPSHDPRQKETRPMRRGGAGLRDADAARPSRSSRSRGNRRWRPSRRINRTRWPRAPRRYSRASAGREKRGRPLRALRRQRRFPREREDREGRTASTSRRPAPRLRIGLVSSCRRSCKGRGPAGSASCAGTRRARGGPGGAAAFARSSAGGDETDAQARGGPAGRGRGAPLTILARGGRGAERRSACARSCSPATTRPPPARSPPRSGSTR